MSLSSILPLVSDPVNEDEYDMDCSDGFIVPTPAPVLTAPVVEPGFRTGPVPLSGAEESSEDYVFYSEGEGEEDGLFEHGTGREIEEPLSSIRETTTADVLERMNPCSPATAPQGRRAGGQQRLSDLFPENTSLFESYLGPSSSSPQEPATVSSKDKWPVSMVMMVNVPASIIKGSGSARKIVTLTQSTKGLARLKLLELISCTCFNASNEPEEEASEAAAAAAAAGQIRSRRRRRAPPPPPPVPAPSSTGEEEAGEMTAGGRRVFDIINNQLRSGAMGGGGGGGGERERRGEARDVDMNVPSGTFCHTFINEHGGEEQILVPTTTQYVEAVRTEGEHAYLSALRFWFLIRDPSFSVVDEMEKVMKRHKKGHEKSLRNKNQGSIASRYDSPINWKVYRSVQTAKSYGRLLDDYFGVELSARTQTSIRGMPPNIAFQVIDDDGLLRGLDVSAAESVRMSQRKLSNYLTIEEDGTIRLTGLKNQDMGRGIRELERTELSPDKLCDIVAPCQMVSIDTTTDRIMHRGSGPHNEDDQNRLNVESLRSRVEELDINAENASSEYATLINRANADRALYGGYDAGTGKHTSWNPDEVNEIETSNKALRHKEKNHNERTRLRRLYMVSDPPRYIQEMKAFREKASKALISDIKGYRDEKESWYDAVVRIFQFGESLAPHEFWPAFALTCDNLGVFGNAMVQEYAAFIDAFRIQPGWKPRDLQKYLVISLNVLEYAFCLHLHALLSGAAQTGKSFLLLLLIEMRVAQTVEKITTMTENSLTSDPRAFNYKTIVMEEASSWCLGMEQDGRPAKMQSSILKDILTSCTANSLRCNWQDGETSRSATFAVMMTNFIFASNWGYPPKSTPLVSRLLVEDVADDEGKKIPVAEIAFALTGRIVNHLKERICKEKKVEQYLHLLVELFVLAEACEPKVNLDIPLFLMDDVFTYLKDHHDVPVPSVRFREQFLKTCRVLTIQHAIRSAYFTEAGQIKYQYRTKKELDSATGEPTGRTVFITDDDGNPLKRGFDMETIVDAIEPRLFCTEDIFAYAMTMLEGHIIPKLEADVINAFSVMLSSADKEHRFIRSKMIHPSAVLYARTLAGAELPQTDADDEGVHRYQEKVRASILDPHYYVLQFNSLEAFYRETASHSERGICETTVQTIVTELKERTLSVTPKPNLLQFQRDEQLVFGVDPISYSMNSGRSQKRKKIPYIRIERTQRGQGYIICIAKDLVEDEEDLPSETTGASAAAAAAAGAGSPSAAAAAATAAGSPSAAAAAAVADSSEPSRNPTVDRCRRRTRSHYQQAMRDALVYALSYHTTRPRDIVLSKSYAVGPKKIYHELLDVIHVEPKPRILYRQQRLVSGLLGPLLVYYTGDEGNEYMGLGADLVVVDGNFELEVAKNHARWIGREFDPEVLPAVQDRVIKLVREHHKGLFPNATIQYPEDARFIVDAQGAKGVYVRKRVSAVSTFEEIDTLMSEPFMKTRKLGNYFEAVEEEGKREHEEQIVVFETVGMRVAEAIQDTEEQDEDKIYAIYTKTLDEYESESERMRVETESAQRERISSGDMVLPDYHPTPPEERLDQETADRIARINDVRTQASNARHELNMYAYAVQQERMQAVLEEDHVYDRDAQDAFASSYDTVRYVPSASRSSKRSQSECGLARLHSFRRREHDYRNRYREDGTEGYEFVPTLVREEEEGAGSEESHSAAVAAELLTHEASRDAFHL